MRARVHSRRSLGCAACAVLALLLLVPRAAWPHGGVDDEPPAAAPPRASVDQGQRVAWTQTPNFELVLKYPAQALDRPVLLRVLLSDWATNAPIQGGAVQLQFTGPAAVSVQAEPTDVPGMYEVAASFPATGAYELLAIVTAGDVIDLMTLSRLEMGPPPPSQAPAAGAAGGRLPGWALIAGAVGLFALALMWGVAIGSYWAKARARSHERDRPDDPAASQVSVGAEVGHDANA